MQNGEDPPGRGRRVLDYGDELAFTFALAIVGARILFPSEDADQGTGLHLLPFAFLPISWLALSRGIPSIRGVERHSLDRHRPLDRRWLASSLMMLLALLASAAAASYTYPAQVMAWEWMGMLSLGTALATLRSGVRIQQLLAFTLALAVGQALLAIWQVFVTFPELAKQWRQHSNPLDPALRLQWEGRFLAGDAFGTFGHPNSLALLLGIGVVLAWSLILPDREDKDNRSGQQANLLRTAVGRLPATLLAAVLGWGLLLTHCRSMVVVTLLACGGLLLHSATRVRNRLADLWGPLPATMRWAAATILVVLIGIGIGLSFLASNSLRYRLEWWQGTWPIICSQPWAGVGWGNFRDAYLEHKLPFSSEEVRDPHNLPLELWATSGIFFLLAYSALVITTLSSWRNKEVLGKDESHGDAESTFVRSWAGLAGGLLFAGISAAWSDPLATPLDPRWFTLLLGGILVAPVIPAIARMGTERVIIVLVTVVLAAHVHWMVSGGAGYPAVMGLVLVFLAAIPTAIPTSFRNISQSSDRVPAANGFRGIEIGVLVALGAAWWAWPVCVSRTTPWLVDDQRDVSCPDRAEDWIELGNRLASDPGRTLEAIAVMERAIQLQPLSAQLHRRLGLLHWQAAAERQDPAFHAEQAADRWNLAASRYPHSALLRWEQACALWLKDAPKERIPQAARLLMELRSGNGDARMLDLPWPPPPEALAAFRSAIWLDQTPHPDKRLPDSARALAQRILERERAHRAD